MRRSGACIAAILAVAVLPASPVGAHETQAVGELEVSIGWMDEPAHAGQRNAVEVAVADQNGNTPEDLEVSLVVEVLFGVQSTSLALVPGDRPGHFVAPLLPTRAGTYAFALTGHMADEAISITSECGPATFDCVTDASDLQFPERDPSVGELAARLESELSGPPDDAATAASAWPVGPTSLAAVAALLALASLALTLLRQGKTPRDA